MNIDVHDLGNSIRGFLIGKYGDKFERSETAGKQNILCASNYTPKKCSHCYEVLKSTLSVLLEDLEEAVQHN